MRQVRSDESPRRRYAQSSAARPADLGHRPLQLPLHLLHAEGGLRPRLRFPAERRNCSPSRRSRGWPASSSGTGVEKIRLTGGEPLLRRDVEKLVAHARRRSTGCATSTLTTNGSLLDAQGAGAARTPGCSRITVSLDSLDDAVFQAMNDVGFPVERVLEGIEAAREAGLWPIKINMVVKRGVERGRGRRRWRATSAAPAHILRFIEYMDVGNTNGWRMDDVVPAAEIVRADRRGAAARADRRRLPRRGRRALALPRRRRRDRHHLLRHAAVLRRLHAGAALRRGAALHLPVRRASATTCGPCCAAGRATTEIAARRRSVWQRAGRSLLRAAHADDGRPAAGRDVAHRGLMAITRDFTVAVFVVHADRVLLHFHRKLGMWLPPGRPHRAPRATRRRGGPRGRGGDRRAARVSSASAASTFPAPRIRARSRARRVSSSRTSRRGTSTSTWSTSPSPSLAARRWRRRRRESTGTGWYALDGLEALGANDEIRTWAARAVAAVRSS